MSQQLAVRLRGWRKQRGLSLGVLAARAGVARGTLSGWERGLHQPRLVELEAVLAALDLPVAEREAILALIEAPRARRALAPAAAAAGLEESAQPAPGELLRALRQRRGLTLDAVARVVGADRASISRWERSLSTPSSERLDRLLGFLGARSDERAALLTGRHHLRPLPAVQPSALETLREQIAELSRRVTYGDRALLDLDLLTWRAAIWPLVARSDAARELLAFAWASYAEWLTWDGRWREAGSAARQAIDLLQLTARPTPAFINGMQCAVQAGARVIAQSTAVNARAAAVERLRVWLPEAAGSHWEADLCRHLAEQVWWVGEPTTALAFADRGCSLAEQLDDEGSFRWCRYVKADLLLRSGRPHEACALAGPPRPADPPYGRILDALRWARALHDVGENRAADWLAEAYALIEQYDYAPLRAAADELSLKF
jgi:transcriptional regulator with XRE-family HTH domain